MTPSDATRELLGRLVAFDTTSRNSNIGLIDFIEDYLDGHGIKSLRVDYEPGRKTNLYATIGPEGPGGIVLSGHTDVVPVDGQDWDSDPFAATESERPHLRPRHRRHERLSRRSARRGAPVQGERAQAPDPPGDLVR